MTCDNMKMAAVWTDMRYQKALQALPALHCILLFRNAALIQPRWHNTQTKAAASPHGIGGLKHMKFMYRTIASREALAGVIASSLRCGAAAATSTEGAAEHQMQPAQAEHN